MPFGINAPLFRRNGGGYVVGFVIDYRFVGLIQFSGMAAFTCLSGRRSACSPAVEAGKRNGYGVLEGATLYVSRGAEYENLVSYEA